MMPRFMLTVILLAVAVACGTTSSDQPAASAAEAEAMCQQFVTEQLNTPSTTMFSPATDAQSLGANTWRISAYVDAENTSGAMIRTTYDCTVQQTGDGSWRLTNLATEP